MCGVLEGALNGLVSAFPFPRGCIEDTQLLFCTFYFKYTEYNPLCLWTNGPK